MTNSVSRFSVVVAALCLCLTLFLNPALSLAAVRADVLTIRDDAPEQYVVVKGDTLWDISARFLEEPWHWPQIWGLNPQIEDPHWIYPGDLIGLEYVNGEPRIIITRGSIDNNLETRRLSPEIRRQSISGAIPSISLEDINSLLSGNRVVTLEEIDRSPYLLEGRNNGIYSSKGDIIFARGEWATGVNTYDIVRPGRSYRNPDSGEIFAVEGVFVGTASLVGLEGDQATLRVEDNLIEARNGDRFIPRAARVVNSTFFPEPFPFDIDANVVGIQSGHSIGGNLDSLVLDIGLDDNLEVGHLLTIQKQDYEVEDNNVLLLPGGRDRTITFAGETFANVMVYRVFEHNSLALVLDTNDVIRMNDRVVAP